MEVKKLPANAGDARDVNLIPGSARYLRVGNGIPLQYSCLVNPTDKGACCGCKELDAFEHTHTHTHTHTEKAMAPHSSTLAWQIPWMEEPGRLQSMGSRRVGHD